MEKSKIKMKQISIILIFFVFWIVSLAKEKSTVSRFDFGSGKTKKGWTQVTPSTLYSAEKGFGLFPSGVIPEAMRQLANEANVPLIDLNAMSEAFYEALGTENSKKAFVHYPANSYPGQDKPLADDTHFNSYGAYELAKCVVQGIQQNIPDVARFIRDDWTVFDPLQPDPVSEFRWFESRQ